MTLRELTKEEFETVIRCVETIIKDGEFLLKFPEQKNSYLRFTIDLDEDMKRYISYYASKKSPIKLFWSDTNEVRLTTSGM